MFDRIKRVVCARYEIDRADLIGHRRFNKFVRPRQIAMYLAKRLTFCSLPEIGRRFGGKDHTTVLHSHRKIAALMASDAVFAADIESLCAKLKRG
jgi:chromosomal replication initiator protein